MDWKRMISIVAKDMLGVSVHAVEAGRENQLYPNDRILFCDEQFLTPEQFCSFWGGLKPYVPCFLQDRLGVSWAALNLDDKKILVGPFVKEVFSREMTKNLLSSLSLDISLLDDFRRYIFFSDLIDTDKIVNLLKTYCHLFADHDPNQPQFVNLLQDNPLKITDDDSNKYIEHYQDMEAAYSAAIAHGNSRVAEEILRELQKPYIHQSTNESTNIMRDISGFTTQLTYARIAGRRAGVPAAALDLAFRKFQNKALYLYDHNKILALSYEATRTFCDLVNQDSRHDYSAHVRNSIDYINRNYQQPITLQAVADHLGINASVLSAAFHRETGKTLTEYLNRTRLEHACILLSMSDFLIKDICAASGISDQSYFTRLFRETYGVSPTEYRRELIGKDKKAQKNRV